MCLGCLGSVGGGRVLCMPVWAGRYFSLFFGIYKVVYVLRRQHNIWFLVRETRGII